MLESALARARRFDLGVGVLFLDLDNFKLVNDSLGHHAGDQSLIQLAQRLRVCTRETDLVARLSGDEFLLLLADLDRGAGALGGGPDAGLLIAESVASRVREALEQPFDLGGSEFFVSASIGISLYPQDASDAEMLLRNADAAMYRSKEFERGGYVVYASNDDDPAHRLSFSTRDCVKRSPTGTGSCTTNRSSTWVTGPCTPSKRSCDGCSRTAGWWHRASSSRSPRRWG